MQTSPSQRLSSRHPESVVIRALWPAELHRFQAHLLRLDPEARIERFGRGVSDEWMAQYCNETDWLRAVILGCFVDGTLRGAAELKLIGAEWPPTAEVAVTVERTFQARGLGSALLRRLVLVARNRGIATLHMLCSSSNMRVRRIATRLATSLTQYGDQIEGTLVLPLPSVATVAAEIAEEGWAAWRSLAPAA